MNHPSRVVAFFDVDETLINRKSMASFLAFYWQRSREDRNRYARARDEHLRRQAAGVSRTQLNRAFYRNFRGAHAEDLHRAGGEWFAAEQARGDLFHPPAVEALRAHRLAGHHIALVSGSFLPCLAPVADALRADTVLCTTPEVREGVLTGEVGPPVIGPRKAELARRTMGERGADPAGCHAYGDHSSDADLLRAVGRPVVVGADPVLNELALREGWATLPGSPRERAGTPQATASATPVGSRRPVPPGSPR
ncbi:HAD family hydrolase [Streptomyces sp. NPDC051742]|uniref:HAD family hydrolase n=1 Tax=unclassified Streptomyces TaxID=2593676 RepID=UPI003439431D